jgi:hypothetical protein
MNILAALSLVVCIAALLAIVGINIGKSPDQYFLLGPPYAYTPGDYWSELNSFFFVFVFSLLFFGFASPVALGIEGAKHASSLLAGAPYYDLLFIVPAVVACLSATWLGQGLYADLEGRIYVFKAWPRAAVYFDIALVLLAVLLALRPTVVA